MTVVKLALNQAHVSLVFSTEWQMTVVLGPQKQTCRDSRTTDEAPFYIIVYSNICILQYFYYSIYFCFCLVCLFNSLMKVNCKIYCSTTIFNILVVLKWKLDNKNNTAVRVTVLLYLNAL